MTNTSMTIDDAFKIAGGFITASDEEFAKAFDIVKKYNEDIILKTQKAYESKDENALMDALDELEKYDASLAKTLREAYKNKEETFSSTLNSRKDEVVEAFSSARNSEKALANAIAEEEEIKVSSEVLAKNTEILYNLLDDKELEENILKDSEIKEAIDNTVIVKFDEATKSKKELSVDERDQHFKMLIEKAKLDVFIEQSKTEDYSAKTPEEQKSSLFEEVKMSFLGTVAEVRTASLIADKEQLAKLYDKDPDNWKNTKAGDAVEQKKADFFQKQLEDLGSGKTQYEAIDFGASNEDDAKKVEVLDDFVIQACAEADIKAQAFEKKLDQLSKACQTSSNTKDANNFDKAWQKVNSFRTNFAHKARQIWNERYNFALALKDNAPKITINLAATTTLLAATATQAPWLGTAVIAYGAYKATSAWVWPIVTKARKNAREQKKKYPKIKTKFVDHLREAANGIFYNKEERKKYFKEAAWGSAAGIVGLGAAGLVGASAGAIAAKSAQSLSSLAVSSVNNAINTIATLKDKDKGFWSKTGAFLVGSAAIGAFAYVVSDDVKDMLGKGFSGIKNFFSGKDGIEDALPVQGNLSAEGLEGNETPTNVSDTTKTEKIIPTEKTIANAKVEQSDLSQASEQSASSVKAKATPTGESVASEAKEEVTLSNNNVTENTTEAGVSSYKGTPDVWDEKSGITLKQWEKLRAIWGSPEQYEEFYNRISDDMLKEGGMFEGMTREQVLFKYQRLSSWNLSGHEGTINNLNKFFCGKNIELTDKDYNIINSVTKTGAIEGVVGDRNVVVEHLDVDCGCNDVDASKITETSAQTTIKTETNNDNTFTSLGKGDDVDLTTTQNEQLTLNKANGLGGSSKVVDNVDSTEVTAKAQNVDVVTNAKSTGSVIEGSLGQETDFNPQDESSLFSNQGKGEDISISSDDASATLNKSNGLTGNSEVINTAEADKIHTNAQNVNVVTNAVNGGTVVEGTPGSEENFEFSGKNEEDFNPNGSEGGVKVSKNTEEGFETITKTEEVVVEGTEGVELGTKAAGNIEERGGFEYTGLSEEQYNATKTYYQDKFGNGAYDRFASRITDDMRAKGGIFEGLSVEQSMFAMKQITSWGYGETGQFNQEVDSLFNYLKGCEGSISNESSASIKALVDRVNEDGTMDGVVGEKAIMTRHFVVGDCGEASSLVTEKALEGHTEASDDDLKRLFMKPQTIVVSREPIFNDLGETEDLDLTSTEQLNITKLKANNLDGVKVVDDNVDAKEVTDGIKAESKEVVTDKGSIKQTEASGEFGKGSVKTPETGKEEDFVADANKNRTYNGRKLSENPAIAKWQRDIF